MATSWLTQSEANALIAMRKFHVEERDWHYPGPGDSLSIPLQSRDRSERFKLDLYQGFVSLSKRTYQTRGRQVIVFVRLDLGGRPHRNPDGRLVPYPHLHLFREGCGDKFAIPVPSSDFSDLDNNGTTLREFMEY